MLSPRDRYRRDPMFTHLVDSLYIVIEAAQYTPTEIREAAILAQIIYEERHVRPIFLGDRQIARGGSGSDLTGSPFWPPYDKDVDNPLKKESK